MEPKGSILPTVNSNPRQFGPFCISAYIQLALSTHRRKLSRYKSSAGRSLYKEFTDYLLFHPQNFQRNQSHETDTPHSGTSHLHIHTHHAGKPAVSLLKPTFV